MHTVEDKLGATELSLSTVGACELPLSYHMHVYSFSLLLEDYTPEGPVCHYQNLTSCDVLSEKGKINCLLHDSMINNQGLKQI